MPQKWATKNDPYLFFSNIIHTIPATSYSFPVSTYYAFLELLLSSFSVSLLAQTLCLQHNIFHSQPYWCVHVEVLIINYNN